MKKEALDNPYDYTREQFVATCRKQIGYLNVQNDDILKKLYYSSKQQFFQSGQVLFDVGQ